MGWEATKTLDVTQQILMVTSLVRQQVTDVEEQQSPVLLQVMMWRERTVQYREREHGRQRMHVTTQPLTWKVDITRPVINGVGSDQNLGCNPTDINGNFSSPTASDGCGGQQSL